MKEGTDTITDGIDRRLTGLCHVAGRTFASNSRSKSPCAGLINGISLAIVAGTGLAGIARVIHTYPTQAEAIKKAADACNARG